MIKYFSIKQHTHRQAEFEKHICLCEIPVALSDHPKLSITQKPLKRKILRNKVLKDKNGDIINKRQKFKPINKHSSGNYNS